MKNLSKSEYKRQYRCKPITHERDGEREIQIYRYVRHET